MTFGYCIESEQSAGIGRRVHMSFLAAEEYREIAKGLKLNTKALIDGRLVDSVSGETFKTVNPATGKVLADIASCNEEDVDMAVKVARKSFESGVWSDMNPSERKERLIAFAELIHDNALELAVMESIDSGKPIVDTIGVDLPETIKCFKYAAETIDKLNDEITPTDRDVVNLVYREPIGVCAAILPWNFPILMCAWKLAPMLAAGNSVVVKPAKLTSLTLLKLAELSIEAGIPGGVLNVLPGSGKKVGDALARHMDVDLITFTGSTAVGKKLLACAGQSNGKRVLLEMGGKNACIVMPDVRDLDYVASQIASAAMWNMGENCTQNSRILIHKNIKAALVPKIADAIKKWKTGDPLDSRNSLGALIEKPHMEKVLEYIETGKAEGARLVCGGERILSETGGSFVNPAVFDGCNQNMKIVREEIFGPVVALETFSTAEEAAEMANDTEYGLQASVYSEDISTIHYLAKKVKAGVISVNHFSEGDVTVPFGGVKQSGFFGRDKSVWANMQYTEMKSINIKIVVE